MAMIHSLLALTFIGNAFMLRAQDRLAFFSDRDSMPDIYLLDTGNGATKRLTNSKNSEYGFVWSSDGRWLAYNHYVGDSSRIEVLEPASDSAVWRGPWHIRISDWSPDGKNMLVSQKAADRKDQVFLLTWPEGAMEQLTHAGFASSGGRYSPDGSRIVFTRQLPARHPGVANFRWHGTRHEVRIKGTARFDALPAWSPDGAWIAYHSCDRQGCHLRKVRPDGSGEQTLVLDGFDNRWPAWSPDGRWLVYTSVRGDTTQLVRVKPSGRRKTPITNTHGRNEVGAFQPRERP
ncbi:MAG: PD40 domain-containing protein [Flavobacteriales bacterium]|nr:PD40 domain-containing protein [Flavobacteriales bacterium]